MLYMIVVERMTSSVVYWSDRNVVGSEGGVRRGVTDVVLNECRRVLVLFQDFPGRLFFLVLSYSNPSQPDKSLLTPKERLSLYSTCRLELRNERL
jgi:hypothetical protein